MIIDRIKKKEKVRKLKGVAILEEEVRSLE